ncbi:HesA/MoeB/ThiF family protein [Fundidesulfovibrio butyratiphilus]
MPLQGVKRAYAVSSFPETLLRNLGAVTAEQQDRLRDASAAVVGCGGLGGHVVDELVRIGVGRLHLFDPDAFSPSNCNRQLNALRSTMGRNKAEAAARRASEVHAFGTVRAFASDFRDQEADEAFRVDVVVDCLDDLPARRDLAALCGRRGLPLVHGAVAGWCGQVGVHMPGGDLLDRLYPARVSTAAQTPAVLSFTVAVIASLQAAEAVKLLLGLPSALREGWMHVDLRECDFLVQHDS